MARVENPWDESSGWAAPSDPARGPYIFTRRIGGVPQTTGIFDELYVGRNPAAHTIDIPSTTSTSARSDLIVARVENPWDESSGWAAPSDPARGPYIFTRRIGGVPQTTTTAASLGLDHSMIALARIDIPASTSKIIQSMITDLRVLAQPKNQRYMRVAQTAEAEFGSKITSSAWTYWLPTANITVPCPAWATHCRIRSIASGFGLGEGSANASYSFSGAFKVRLGNVADNVAVESPAAGLAYDIPVGAYYSREVAVCGGEGLALPASLRGGPVVMRLVAQRNSGNTGIFNSGGTNVSHEVEFYNLPTANV